MVRINGPVLQDKHFKTVFHGIHRIAADPVQRGFQRSWFAIGPEITLQCFGLENARIDTSDFLQVMVGKHRMFKRYRMRS